MKTIVNWALGIIVVVGALWLVVAFVSWMAEGNSKAHQALKSYRNAVELCGEENVQEHEYTDGSKDFDCADYSQLEK